MRIGEYPPNIGLGDIIFYLKDSRPHSAKVLSILTVQNAHDEWAHTKEQKQLFQPFGPSGIYYVTVHGVVAYSEVSDVDKANNEA